MSQYLCILNLENNVEKVYEVEYMGKKVKIKTIKEVKVCGIWYCNDKVREFGNITLNGATQTPPIHSQYSWQRVNTSTYYIQEVAICIYKQLATSTREE